MHQLTQINALISNGNWTTKDCAFAVAVLFNITNASAQDIRTRRDDAVLFGAQHVGT
jgi:hypothetical protein